MASDADGDDDGDDDLPYPEECSSGNEDGISNSCLSVLVIIMFPNSFCGGML